MERLSLSLQMPCQNLDRYVTIFIQRQCKNACTCTFIHVKLKGGSSLLLLKLFLNHYENTPIQIYWNFLPSKNENFQIKNSNIFHISARNIGCGYSLEPPWRGGSNEYPQSMFLRRNKKNNVYPCKPQFYYTKMGFKGVKII